MNIQIFGKSKCFDTKKAERYFKERRVKYQYIDMKKYGISRGELNGVLRSVPLSDLVDPKHPDAALLSIWPMTRIRWRRCWKIPHC